MDGLKKLKLALQRKEGKIVTEKSLALKEDPITDLVNPQNIWRKKQKMEMEQREKAAKPTDGYWVIIQDWSQCSKACGGGIQLQHRMCVPPTNGGNPCMGEGIQRRPCNQIECPIPGKNGVDPNNLITGEKNKVEVMKAKLKILRFSSTPQRYEKCIRKESDLLYSVDTEEYSAENPKKHNVITQPARVVMNNSTITVFSGSEYDDTKATFLLRDTSFLPSAEDRFCFVLKDHLKKGRFCPLGTERNNEYYNQWDYDFHLFKMQCHTKKEVKVLDAKDMKKIDEAIKDAKQKLLIDKQIDIIAQTKEQDVEKKEDEIVKNNKLSLQAIQKQLNVEAMIEKEEKKREEEETEMLQQEIEKEKKKQQCAIQRIKEKEIENQYNVRADEVEQENQEIKRKAAEEISKNRAKLKNKIKFMRQTAERKKQALRAQLLSMRREFANKMGSTLKKGNQDNCISVISSKENYKNYCTRAFPNNPVEFGSCVDSDNPCFTCCEIEFSELFYYERNKCIKDICKSNKHAMSEEGKWVWQKNILDNEKLFDFK